MPRGVANIVGFSVDAPIQAGDEWPTQFAYPVGSRFEDRFSELINDRYAIAAFSESFVRLFSKWQYPSQSLSGGGNSKAGGEGYESLGPLPFLPPVGTPRVQVARGLPCGTSKPLLLLADFSGCLGFRCGPGRALRILR